MPTADEPLLTLRLRAALCQTLKLDKVLMPYAGELI